MSYVEQGKNLMRSAVVSMRERVGKTPGSGREASPQPTPDAPPRDPQVRVAVLGAGKIAPEHLKVLRAFDDVAIVGISNRGNSDLTPLAEEYEIEQTFSNWTQMLDTVQPDAVLILVSHFVTVEVAADCIRRGIPALIEKPVGFSSAETAQLADLAAQHGTLNMVAVNRRYYSTINAALRAVRVRGPLLGVQVEAPEAIRRIRQNSRHGDELLDRWLIANSIHAIDLFRHIGGEVAELHTLTHAWREPHADSFSSTMRFENGALGTFIAHWQSTPGWRLSIYGDGVKAVLEPFEAGALHYPGGKVQTIKPDPVDIDYKPGFYRQARAFIDALVYDEPLAWPASDLADTVKTMRLIEQIGQLEQ